MLAKHDNIYRMIMKTLMSSMESVNFLGVSGDLRFSKGDRIALTMVEQFQKGEYKLIGYYDTVTNNWSKQGDLKWANGDKPPADRTIIKASLMTINPTLYIGSVAVSGIGILFAIGLICFNCKFSEYRYIEMSYPIANNFMLLGCIVCFITIVFFGLDGKIIPHNYFVWICYMRALFVSIGFSLYFGSMFAKSWITYRLSTSTSSKRKVCMECSAENM